MLREIRIKLFHIFSQSELLCATSRPIAVEYEFAITVHTTPTTAWRGMGMWVGQEQPGKVTLGKFANNESKVEFWWLSEI